MKLNIDHPLYVVGYAVVLSAAFSAAVISVQVATAAKLERNLELREDKALVQVFDLGDVEAMSGSEITQTVEKKVTERDPIEDPETGHRFRWFETDGAIAFEYQGNGFWAPITGLMALTPDLRKLTGMVVLDQGETPGLGGRITEQQFREQFEGLDVTPPSKGAQFLYVVRERPDSAADPRHGRSVEAITGATQTSMAMEQLLNANIEAFRRAYQARGSAGTDGQAARRQSGTEKDDV